MKNTLLVILCLLAFNVDADFNDATEAYANKNYQNAYDKFKELAQLGNKRAQFNLGVMYLNGEHVKTDKMNAYAWGKLSEHKERPEFSKIRITLEKQFNAAELELAIEHFNAIKDVYGDEKIYANLSPIVFNDSKKNSDSQSKFSLKVLKRNPPRYPKEAYYDRIQGWTTVGFDIYPDGSVRYPYVIDSFPINMFDNESLKAAMKFKFDIQFAQQVEPYPVQARQTIEYSLENLVNEKKLRRFYDERLENLKKMAEQGSAVAQYLFAVAASSNIVNKGNKMPQEEVNQWLLKSAQNGHIEAQYQLGKNILRGKGCKIEKQKGIDWIVYAAEQGHPRSSRTAYSLLTRHNNLNNTHKPAEHWLKMAAENGDADSQIDYAEFLANKEQPDPNELKIARNFLEKQSDLRDKSVKWYQISASIYQKQGDEKKANKHHKKAQKMAKKLGWEI